MLSGEVPRTAAATFLPTVLHDMLRRDLREGAGGAYAPWSSYEAVDAESAVVLAGSDVAESLLPTVVHYARSGLARLRSAGPLPDVVENAVARSCSRCVTRTRRSRSPTARHPPPARSRARRPARSCSRRSPG